MVPLIVFILLFNLTYTSTQNLSEEHNKFHDSLQLGIKFKNNSTSNASSSSSKIDDIQDNGALEIPPAIAAIEIAGNPFSGKDEHGIVPRQDEKVPQRQDGKAPQSQEISNNEQNHNEVPANNEATEAKDPNKKKIDPSDSNIPLKQIKSNNTNNEDKSSEKSSTLSPIRIRVKEDIMQSGALLRGFYVFLGLSVISMIYFIFRSYRLQHGSQPSTTVRKYGVTARRSDMEMRPLELDDDDDDTLFEIGNQNTYR